MRSRKEQLIEMLAASPNDEFLKYAIAIEEEKEGNTIKAIEILKELSKENPKYEGTYLKLSQLYEAIDDIENAKKTATEGILIAQQSGNKKMEQELNQLLLNLL